MIKNNQQELKTEGHPERLISIKELSELTGMKVSTLYLWSSTHRIPVIHAGKSLRYRYSDVLKAFESTGNHEH